MIPRERSGSQSYSTTPATSPPNREYATYTGTYQGVPVSVTSTGIGCPSTAIAIEELASVGARTLIRTGTSGSMTPDVSPGEVIVGTGAIREEGTGISYLPAEFPAVPDLDTTICLRAAAEALGLPVRAGVLHSKDSFYSHRDPGRVGVAQELRGKRAAWRAGGALASEMETSTLFILGVHAARENGFHLHGGQLARRLHPPDA